ncbi:MAG: putative Ig domain-containing protein [Gammaproteobacteria bacterium]|nr:putative Ig domain-containing protein [Gammaproteobacteria bacterium]
MIELRKITLARLKHILLPIGTLIFMSACLAKVDSATDVDGQPIANNAPVIQGAPLNAVKIGESYEFLPQASDADGDPLTFSIQNRPVWAQFDSGTGRLSGIPTLGNEGEYANIRITVSDGTDTSSIAFAITVTTVGSASVTLSWTPPVENEDGTTLTDLAGYYIYYGDSQGTYPNSIRIDNPSVSTYIVGNLTPNTYYFVATSFNSMRIESAYSNEATKTAL